MGRSDKLGVCYLEVLVILVLLFRICRAPLDLEVWGFRHADLTDVGHSCTIQPNGLDQNHPGLEYLRYITRSRPHLPQSKALNHPIRKM